MVARFESYERAVLFFLLDGRIPENDRVGGLVNYFTPPRNQSLHASHPVRTVRAAIRDRVGTRVSHSQLRVPRVAALFRTLQENEFVVLIAKRGGLVVGASALIFVGACLLQSKYTQRPTRQVMSAASATIHCDTRRPFGKAQTGRCRFVERRGRRSPTPRDTRVALRPVTC